MKYVALLRGIMPNNPKTRNEKLKKVFESLSFKNVQTVIASGNVIFETQEQKNASLEKKIEGELVKQLDFDKPVVVRSQEDLIKLTKRKPFKDLKGKVLQELLVTFFKDERPEMCFMLDKTKRTTDYMRDLEKANGKTITSRTGKTVERILQKMIV